MSPDRVPHFWPKLPEVGMFPPQKTNATQKGRAKFYHQSDNDTRHKPKARKFVEEFAQNSHFGKQESSRKDSPLGCPAAQKYQAAVISLRLDLPMLKDDVILNERDKRS